MSFRNLKLDHCVMATQAANRGTPKIGARFPCGVHCEAPKMVRGLPPTRSSIPVERSE